MTRTALRLAELDRIGRERELTDSEQAEAYRLVRLQRQCDQRRRRYAIDPNYRQKMIDRARDWRLTSGGHVRRHERALTRDEHGRFA